MATRGSPRLPSTKQRRIDRHVCGAAPPRGLVRLNNPPSAVAAVAAWPPAGLPAVGDHSPGHRGKSDAAQPPAPFSIPLVQAHLHPPRPGFPHHPQGGRSISRSPEVS